MTATTPPPPADNLPLRCVTIDVEEYFHIEAAYGVIERSQWDTMPSRVDRNIDLLLELMRGHGLRGTFFILGDVARRNPAVVTRIADAGHEIASHGANHDRLHRLDRETFRQDLRTCKGLLEDRVGRAVVGYRAPTFSLVPQTAWAIDVLLECGFQYDSSIYPVHHPLYGVPAAPDRPFHVRAAPDRPSIFEIPPLTLRVSGKNFAVAGGGYFRLLPLWFMKRGLAQAAGENRPSILYFHPWEFDPDMPRLPLKLLGRVRTYTGLKSAARRLDSILSQPARWSPIGEALDDLRHFAEGQTVFTLSTLIHPDTD